MTRTRRQPAPALPPHNEQVEAAVLGALLEAPQRAAERLRKLVLQDFYLAPHRLIFEAISAIVAAGRQPSPGAVYQWLSDEDRLPNDGFAAVISALPDKAGSFDADLAALKEWTFRRGLARLGAEASGPGPDIGCLTGRLGELLKIGTGRPGGLPEIEDACALLAAKADRPPELVRGILHQGTKLAVGGASKSYKTWVLADLGISVASGAPWWGFETRKGRVLFCNFEIPGVFFRERLAALSKVKGIRLSPHAFDHWGLRGHALDFDRLQSEFLARLNGERYVLIILDPVYKLLGARDENAAGDIASLLNGFERLAVQSGAAVAFGSHFAKGNASQKEAIDRISGSGVFARDPDSILTLTRHETEGAFTVDAILRNLPPVEPFCVQWEYPLMRRVDLDPARLKQPTGRKREYEPKELLKLIADTTPQDPISISAWADAGNVARQTLTDYLPEMRLKGWIGTAGEGKLARQYITEKGRKSLQEAHAGN